MELFLVRNKTYKNACLSDDNEFMVGRYLESIRKITGTDNLNCVDSNDSYAVSALFGSDRYYCVDSTGYAGQVSSSNTGTVCSK